MIHTVLIPTPVLSGSGRGFCTAISACRRFV